jgi:L-malate glycosyltransferase
MRILVLIYEYPPIGGGGGRVAQDVCEGLANQGHTIQILTAHYKDLPFQENLPNLTITRLRSGRSEAFRGGFRAMLGYILATVWAGPGLIRKWKPDVIHVHFAVPSGVAAYALSMLTGKPYVLTAHLGDVPGGVPEKTGKWFSWVFPFTPPIWRKAARVTAVSNYTREIALKYYPVPIEVIPNGVDLKKIDPGELKVNNPPVVVFAGRFVPQKNLLQFVQTLAAVKDLPWKCVIIGDGALRPQIEQEIAKAGLQERFTMPGWLKPEEVLQWFARCDILFMPSLVEGLPVVGVQAMAMGLALVLSRVGGCVDLVSGEENGYLVEKGDGAGFEKSLRALLSNPLRLLAARQASRRLASRYDLDVIVDSYRQVFEQAANQK